MAENEDKGKFPKAHAREANEILEEFSVDPGQGLSYDEVNKNREKYGVNELPQKEETSVVKLFLKQFKDFLILILFIAAGIAFFAGQNVDAYIILAVILFNATMGFIQEYRAEKAVQAIKSMVKHQVNVLRDGETETVESKEVVMGDIVLLEEGQSVPADARILDAKNLRTGEASLTGESEPVAKKTEKLEEDTELGDQENMVWKGTSVVKGSGKAVVIAVGEKTEIGKIAKSLKEMEKTESNFRKKTGTLAKKMAGIAIFTSIIVFCLGYFYRQFDFQEIFLVTIATMVSSIPEGLPVVISIVLAIGANRMAKKNAIIREFTATEMMGSVSTILTDKTGTITQSILTVKRIFGADKKEYEVGGQGYQLKGKISLGEEDIDLADANDILKKNLLISRFGTNATIQVPENSGGSADEENEDKGDKSKNEGGEGEEKSQPESNKSTEEGDESHRVRESRRRVEEDLDRLQEGLRESDPSYESQQKKIERHKEYLHTDIERLQEDVLEEGDDDETKKDVDKKEDSSGQNQQDKDKDEDGLQTSGDPTEVALRILGEKSNIANIEPYDEVETLNDIPFNSEQKFRARLVRTSGDKNLMLVVGAPERILELSDKVLIEEGAQQLEDDIKDDIREQNDKWAEQAFRVLALAHKEMGSDQEIELDDVEGLVWTGIVGMIDPPRPQVQQAIADCKKAGIRVVMLTGDHAKTAAAIARDVGILDHQADGNGEYPEALSESDITDVDDEKLDDMIRHVSVFARMSPQTKLRIAERLQKSGELIAMTGDGVNDAPALKKADVGIAMGQKGTDVAKDAAQIVLSDDNFASIVNAIREGRIVFRNVKLTTYFLLTTNFASTSTLIVALLLGFPIPLTAVQILWVNMVTDGIMDVALATEPGHGDEMSRKPIKKKEHILKWEVMPYLLIMAAIMVTLAIFTFDYYLPRGEEVARTGAFFVIAATQIFNVFNMRDLEKSVFKIGILGNKWINYAFIASIILQLAVVKVPWLQSIFGFGDIAYIDFAVIIVMSSTVLWAGELYKWIRRKTS